MLLGRLTKPRQLALKRAFDIVASSAVLFGGMPVLGLLAVLVKASSKGPIFFAQTRAGYQGKPFRMYKFRTMTHRPARDKQVLWGAEQIASVTSVGAFLRDFGLDELPQVLNILKGDMSIIGPRPLLPEHIESFSPRERVMLEMRPGVLSLAAVRGRRSLTMRERIDYHVEYVERWSLALDAKILWQSVFVVLGRKDANETVFGEWRPQETQGQPEQGQKGLEPAGS